MSVWECWSQLTVNFLAHLLAISSGLIQAIGKNLSDFSFWVTLSYNSSTLSDPRPFTVCLFPDPLTVQGNASKENWKEIPKGTGIRTVFKVYEMIDPNMPNCGCRCNWETIIAVNFPIFTRIVSTFDIHDMKWIWIISYNSPHFTPLTGKFELITNLASNMWLHIAQLVKHRTGITAKIVSHLQIRTLSALKLQGRIQGGVQIVFFFWRIPVLESRPVISGERRGSVGCAHPYWINSYRYRSPLGFFFWVVKFQSHWLPAKHDTHLSCRKAATRHNTRKMAPTRPMSERFPVK